MKTPILTRELNATLEAFKQEATEYATLQDYVMFLIGTKRTELDYENPFYKEGK